MTKRIVILGGGTGGTLSANRLRRDLGDGAHITVVDHDDDHIYQPGLLFVPFGLSAPEDLVRSRPRQLRDGIHYHRAAVDRVDAESDQVHLQDGTALPYDVLVIATGARLMPEETEGLTGACRRDTVHTFYDYEGAVALESALAGFTAGRLVVNVVDLPIKCPVAPLEFCFLADWYFTERGVRDQVQLTYVTPLDGAFTKPVASRTLAGLLAEKNIELVTEFNTGEVDGTGKRLISYDGREVAFDLAVVVPLHGGASYVEHTPGLGDEFGFVPADPHTLQSNARPNIFVIGDAAALPTSKAGSVTHFEGEVLARNVARFLAGDELDAGFDGHTNCFIESGFHKAMLIDFNYDTEPLTGHFPMAVGLPLLKESRLNHLGKLMFSWLYWHSLLPGRDIPGVSTPMPRAGKHFPVPADH
ncbi:type III sulfide quinone reductase, selenoprotein subtype [Amycolatopsis sp. RTGN1]|uniref:type III sulfide quinone reductase, selenoprotein subtype n=1 Tax=Amycolatopsis ponsaeliensis TaxID=2992142 RepID=UPI00254D6CFE|nr:FAD/NAD(P)-binding oxidoreductase [Amycolatopsis sp. RTGN1]